MGIFSMFRKRSSEDIYQEIASKIVVSSLSYRMQLDETDPQLTGNAAAEVAYLLLHLVDRAAFQVLGEAGRNVAFDRIAKIVISDYAHALFKLSTPPDVVADVGAKMLDDMNDRQLSYAACHTFTESPWPSRGTMVFACGYFIHRALGRTNRTDVDAILRGEENVTEYNIDAFPDLEQTLKLSIHLSNIAATLRLADCLKRLR
ncbi:MAG: hypothetical protein K8R90_06045 [Candidatus Cloacimonetes bacterium]|nr:hypothetical protein [Candidatus Cloacimonadota bacterium]